MSKAKEKVLDISEVKPGDEFVFHTEKFTYDGGKDALAPSQIYRVIAVGEEVVFMGVHEGSYYRETLISHEHIQNGFYVRYKRPKIEKVKRFLVRNEYGQGSPYGDIRWCVDYPGKPIMGAIEVTIVDDKIVEVEIVDA